MNNYDQLIGQTLGRYQIVGKLGKGGMARVYKGYHAALDRYVAIKILHSHLVEEASFVARFEREATNIARLRHPNIVQVHDFDCENGIYYMVMEFVEGPSLRQEMEQRNENGRPPFTLQETTAIIHQLAGAIDYAHARNMIHRDIKPGNIMFTAEGEPLLADFGLSQMIAGDMHQTMDGGLNGTPAYMSPEQCRGESLDGRSDIYALSVILYEMLTGHPPFTSDTPLSLILQHTTDPFPRLQEAYLPAKVETAVLKASQKRREERYETATALANSLRLALDMTLEEANTPILIQATRDTTDTVTPTTTRRYTTTDFTDRPNPYRGLYAFREEDAPLFFGRELITARLVRAIQEQGFVAVVGASGSGKSSVVFAGLLPALREQGDWLIVPCRPGTDPFGALTAVLISYLEPTLSETDQLAEARKLAYKLREREVLLTDVVARILSKQPQATRLLLVSDQFEELYTLCDDHHTQTTYPHLLFEAVGSSFALAITLRADFVGQALGYRPFADALQDNDVKLGPMTRTELADAIEEPARLQGALFEPGLVDRILDDVGSEPGNLPLLEFALTLLWDNRNGRRMNHSTYEAIGRVEGALARYADDIFSQLSPDEQERARRVFIQMVRPGEGTEDTRRIAYRSDFSPQDWQLVNHLADTRLVVTNRALDGEETVEVVHEALIRGWQQLKDWMQEARAFRTWQERLRGVLHQWQESEQDDGALLRGALLAEAEEWLLLPEFGLSSEERAYIEASIAFQQAQVAKQEAQQQAALQAAQKLALAQEQRAEIERQRADEEARANTVFKRLTAVLGLVFILSLILAGIAFNQRGAAQRARMIAENEAEERLVAQQDAQANAQLAATREAEALAAQAEAESERDRANEAVEIALVAQAEAVSAKTEVDDEAEIALARQLAAQGSALADTQPDLALLLSREALRRLGSGETFSSLLGTLQQYQQLEKIHQVGGGIVNNILVLPDGDRFVVSGRDGSLEVWSLKNNRRIYQLKGHDPTKLVNGIDVSANGRWLISTSDDHTLILWDLKTGEQVGEPWHEQSSFVQDAKFMADDSLVVSISGDNLLRYWDVATATVLTRTQTNHSLFVYDMALSPDQTALVTAGLDGMAFVFDAQTGEEIALVSESIWDVLAVAFSPDNQFLLIGRRDGGLEIFDRQTWARIGSVLMADGAVRALTFDPTEPHLAYVGISTGDIFSLDLSQHTAQSAAELVPFAPDGHSSQVTSLAFSLDGSRLFSGDAVANVLQWTFSDTLWPMISQFDSQQSYLFDGMSSGNNQWLITGHDTNVAQLWFDTPSGQPFEPVTYTLNHTGIITSDILFADWLPATRRLVTIGSNGTMGVWNGTTGELVDKASLFASRPSTTAVHPDQPMFAVGGSLGAIVFWRQLADTPEIAVFRGHASAVTDLAFSPDGLWLASVGEDGQLFVRTGLTESRDALSMFVPALNSMGVLTPLNKVVFDPSSTLVATGSNLGDVSVWSVMEGTAVWSMPHSSQTAVLDMQWGESGLWVSYESLQVAQWKDGEIVSQFTSPIPPHMLTLSGTTVIITSDEGKQVVWQETQFVGDIATVEPVVFANEEVRWQMDGNGRLQGQTLTNTLTIEHTIIAEGAVRQVAMSANGQLAATGHSNGSLMLWDTASQTSIMEPLKYDSPILDLAFAPDDQTLFIATCTQIIPNGYCQQSQIDLLDVSNQQIRASLDINGFANSITLTQNDLLLVTGCRNPVDPISGCLAGTAFLWNLQTMEPIGRFHRENGSDLSAATINPEGTIIATADTSNRITLWQVATGEQLGQHLTGHENFILTLSFSPNSQFLLSTDANATMRLWNVRDGQAIGRPFTARPNTPHLFTQFTRDSRMLLSGDSRGQVYIWMVDPYAWADHACDVVGRNLNEAEWARFIPSDPFQLTCIYN